MKILVTGGCGFIGSALVRHLVLEEGHQVVNVDALTYAATPQALESIQQNDAYIFEHANICDSGALTDIFERHRPDAVAHLAAESHVDRSIDQPAAFIQTNLIGTYNVLEAARDWQSGGAPADFRLLHLSTDEVFGSLGPQGRFDEQSRYDPVIGIFGQQGWGRSSGECLAANLRSADHRGEYVQAYGRWQFPEKLIPLMITNSIDGKELPVYGSGKNVREWIYVEDSARALAVVLAQGKVGESYMIGTGDERNNVETVRAVCAILDRLRPDSPYRPHDRLIRFVEDRPGHDGRYAIDARKINRELGWAPRETGDSGMEKTVRWYLENEPWWRKLKSDRYDGRRPGAVEARSV